MKGTRQEERLDNITDLESVLKQAQMGLWELLMMQDEQPKMYADASMVGLLGIEEPVSPEECYQLWRTGIDDEYVEMVDSAIDRMMQDRPMEVEYLWNHPSMGRVFVRFGGKVDHSFTEGICIKGYQQISTKIGWFFKDRDQERKKAAHKEKLLRNISKDSLSGLMNKEYFLYQVRQLVEREVAEQYSLIFLDVEKFKLVNEAYGIQVGNDFLKFLGKTIQKYVPDHFCSRFTADQFVICVKRDGTFTLDTLSQLKDEVQSQFSNLNIRLKCGIYRMSKEVTEPELMCDRAKLACRTIEGMYGVFYNFYDDSIYERILDEQFILDNMEQAYENREFKVYYQPICYTSSEKVSSVEALIRWQHPEKGLIPPDRFIHIFEKNGFITKIDLYVLEQVCKDICEYRNEGREYVPVSINLSRQDFYDSELFFKVCEIMDKYQVPHDVVHIEITESVRTADAELLLHVVDHFRQNGFQIWMDDFGSGYSSFSALKDIPLDVLKIDMNFMENFELSGKAGTIVAAIVNMASWLKIKVVAEGVETKAQLSFLKQIGCELAQGYYFSKPQPLDKVKELFQLDNLTQDRQYNEKINQIQFQNALSTDSVTSMFFNEISDGMGIVEKEGEELRFIRVNQALMSYFYERLHVRSVDELEYILNKDSSKYTEIKALYKRAKEKGGVQREDIRSPQGKWLKYKVCYLGSSGNRDGYFMSFHVSDAMIGSSNPLTELDGYKSILCNVYKRIDLIDYEKDSVSNLFLHDNEYYVLLEGDTIDEVICNFAQRNIAVRDRDKFIRLYNREHLKEVAKEERRSNSSILKFKNVDGKEIWCMIMLVKVDEKIAPDAYLSCIRNLNLDEVSAINCEDYLVNDKMKELEE